MSTTNIAAAELAPVVYCMASALDGARSAIRNLPRAAALLAPALTANARAYNHGLPDAEHLAPVTEADLLAACTVAYCTRTGLHRAAPMALRALGALRYNSGRMGKEEQAALLDAYALCARVAADVMAPRED